MFCVFNLSPAMRAGYRIGVPEKGVYKAVFDSESEAYGGGHGAIRLSATKGESHGAPYHLSLDIAAYSAVYYKPIP